MKEKALSFYHLSSSLFLVVLILTSFFLPFRADGSWAPFPLSLSDPAIKNSFHTSLVIPLCVGTIALLLAFVRLFVRKKDGGYPLLSLSVLSVLVALISGAAAILALALKTPHYPLAGYYGMVALLSLVIFVLDVRSMAIGSASGRALTGISLALAGISVLILLFLAIQPLLLLIS